MSSFKRIMLKGREKIKTTPQTRALLCELTSKNHALIAKVIDQWLKQDNARRPKSSTQK